MTLPTVRFSTLEGVALPPRKSPPPVAGSPVPAPSGSISFPLQCRVNPDVFSRARHPITIHSDWTVSTPHDLDTERIAAALGSYTSCLDLEQIVIPAARAGLARHLRLEPAPIWPALGKYRNANIRPWKVLEPVGDCCEDHHFVTAGHAAAHIRSVKHLSAEYGADTWQLKAVLSELLAEHTKLVYGRDTSCDRWEWPLPPNAAAAVRAICENHGASALWQAGIHSDLVVRIHDQLGTRAPLPARTYLAVAIRSPDIAWVRATLAAAGNRVEEREPHRGRNQREDEILDSARFSGEVKSGSNLALWLAVTYERRDADEPSLRTRWLSSGIPRRIIPELWRGGYSLAKLDSLASSCATTVPSVALSISRWLEKEWHPSIEDLKTLASIGSQSIEPPSTSGVYELRKSVGRSWSQTNDTSLALWLAASPPVALAVREFWRLAPNHQTNRGVRTRLAELAAHR